MRIKITMSIVVILCLIASSYAYEMYKKYSSASNVYGVWVEVNAPSYKADTLHLTSDGVVINYDFISTSFEFDGRTISFHSGSDPTVYNYEAPYLKRTTPNHPPQTLVRKL